MSGTAVLEQQIAWQGLERRREEKGSLRSLCALLPSQFSSPMERQDNPSLRVGIDIPRFV
jgi:hypothetical protein